MFRDVPECSGMFHVPSFIDPRKGKGKLNSSGYHSIYRVDEPCNQNRCMLSLCPSKERENCPDILQQRQFFDLYRSVFLFGAS